MSGHSKWANIKHKKARQDEAKGAIFTKVSKEIMVAVKQGGPDPEGNFRLKLCIQKAKANNMPNDNINRAIQKASGGTDGDNFEEIFYEGYGPGGVAILLAILTDNRNRTASEIRHTFSKNGGNLGETGCVAWMFDRKGRLTVNLENQDEDELMMLVLEAGAEDFKAEEGIGEIITEPDSLEEVRNFLVEKGVTIEEEEVTMIPQNTIMVDDLDQVKKLMKMVESLEDHDDVQNVYGNFDIPDEILAQLED
ncbi:YebC/PmpR family DNA-binding transcriptional regulator [Dehalobacterium formicoaceticum]|uniref:Probable transcriptional regulatory protein NVS47_15050 n=1 Tax=Dehalobacterium formicoaceticum TaxID=51515 RepID=A0ABT1Y7F2_9FIRM|nr:YebC/PmpR family DNA-binding transcriptional regulator [Dehalobacterium formicoaceticum]MCR6546812.1 YebC/PmpR family DNA-binding transcriptional regulator [Dehalobacterium formicoaceticum]